jgi:hypothetical protein
VFTHFYQKERLLCRFDGLDETERSSATARVHHVTGAAMMGGAVHVVIAQKGES